VCQYTLTASSSLAWSLVSFPTQPNCLLVVCQCTLSDGGCVLDNPTVDKLFTFQDMENNRNEAGEYQYSNTIAPEKAGSY
jgi:hypothetical protein